MESSHYPVPTRVLYPDFEQAFWANTKQVGDCREWQGKQDSKGYGIVRIPGERGNFRAHRVSYAMVYGEDPDEMFVCHTCDNPHCVRPTHLFLGDSMDNVHDMIAKGRAKGRDQVGKRNRAAKLTEREAREILLRIMAGEENASIEKDFPIGKATVSHMRSGRTWRHLHAAIGYRPEDHKVIYKKVRLVRPEIEE